MSDWYSGGCGFNPLVGWIQQHSFMEIGHEIISVAIAFLPQIQVGQLSVTDERMCTKYWLTARSKPDEETLTGTLNNIQTNKQVL